MFMPELWKHLEALQICVPFGESCTVDDAYNNGEMEKMI
jgi:hypothetical protein